MKKEYFLIGVLLLIIAMIVGAGGTLYVKTLNWHLPWENATAVDDCCKGGQGDFTPVDGLQLHRWYKARTRLVWNFETVSWRPGERGDGVSEIQGGVPVYVFERRGNVAVVRGATRQLEVLVPDGPHTHWFIRVGGKSSGGPAVDTPDRIEKMIGELPKQTSSVDKLDWHTRGVCVFNN
jgi:hypothetical protein